MNKLLRKCGEYISRTKSALLTLGLVGASLFANAQTFYGIAGSDLVMFTTTTTNSVTTVGTITGLVMGQSLVGLDFRPATGQLYGLGYDASTGAARLYLINRTTAAATPIGATNLAFMAGETGFGMDFNPTVDRIRVITAGGRNYRLHPNTGAIAFTDGNLAYATGDVNVGATDAFVACAYTNSYIGATTTALYDIGAVTNALSLQNPPNNGTLNTIGSIGLTINNTTDATDADIYYDAAMNMNMAYLSTKVGATTNFYGLNTSTGATTLIGALNVALTDFSAQVTPNMPTNISGKLVYGVTANNYLISFDSDAPSVVRMHLPISGLGANQAIAGMDVRPATGQIYVLGYNAMNGDAQLYTLDPSTAALTMVAAPDTIAMGLTQISFDFNPTVDRIRVEASTGQNYRFHLSNLQTGLYYAQLGNSIIKIVKE